MLDILNMSSTWTVLDMIIRVYEKLKSNFIKRIKSKKVVIQER